MFPIHSCEFVVKHAILYHALKMELLKEAKQVDYELKWIF